MEFKVEVESFHMVGKLLNLREICLTELSNNDVGNFRGSWVPSADYVQRKWTPSIREA